VNCGGEWCSFECVTEDDLRDLADPDLRYVAITTEQLLKAQSGIAACIECQPEAEIPFDWLLSDVASERGYVDYIIPATARCPNCGCEVSEKTLIEPNGGLELAAPR
jgi:hypothetical protein